MWWDMLVMKAHAGRTYGATGGLWRAQPKEKGTARAGRKKPLSLEWSLSFLVKGMYANQIGGIKIDKALLRTS